jgi:hypothetical protein
VCEWFKDERGDMGEPWGLNTSDEFGTGEIAHFHYYNPNLEYEWHEDPDGACYYSVVGYNPPKDENGVPVRCEYLLIPPTHEGLPVAKVSDFGITQYYDYIEKVIVCEGITHIEDEAFSNCFTPVHLPSTIKEISDDAFSGMEGTIYCDFSEGDVPGLWNSQVFGNILYDYRWY